MSEGLRKRPAGNFVLIPSETIDDGTVSFRARGILGYLLNRPDGWIVRSEAIAKSTNGEGREAIRTALRELGEGGYYRLERRQMRDGTFKMGTAVGAVPDPEWAEEWADFEGKAVPVVEQPDGTFKVRRKDGTFVDDGFEPAPQTEDLTGETGDGFPGPGFPGAGSPDPGSPDSGSPGPFGSTNTQDSKHSSPSEKSAARTRTGTGAHTREGDTPAAEATATADGSARGRTTRAGTKHLKSQVGDSKRAFRLPEDWSPAGAVWQEMAVEKPGVDLEEETRKFRDFWCGMTVAKGTKNERNWTGTWRNWIRKAAADLERDRERRGLAVDPAVAGEAAAIADRWWGWWDRNHREALVGANRDRLVRLIGDALARDVAPERIQQALMACNEVVPPDFRFRRALMGRPLNGGPQRRTAADGIRANQAAEAAAGLDPDREETTPEDLFRVIMASDQIADDAVPDPFADVPAGRVIGGEVL